MKKVLLFLSALALWSCNSSKTPDIEKIDFSEEQVAEYWQTGKTLPAGVAIQYQPELINMPQDKGYNVLIDVSHQCSFASLWGLGGRLHELGYRSITNQASVNTVLDPEGFCRIRIPYDTENKIYPFAWYPNFNYNVIITEQTDLNAQHYTDKEIKAMVDFVKDGGALVIGAVPVGDQEKLDAWTLNQLVGEQLPDNLQRIDGLLQGFGRETVHQVSVGKDSGPRKVAQRTCGLMDRYSLVH